MWLEVFFRGLFVGLIASLPSFGPVGVLSIQRTLSKSQKSGFITGLGATAADTLYATIAFFSVTIIISFVEHHAELVRIIAGVCVLAIGVYILFQNPAVQMRRNRSGKSNMWQDFLSGFLMTIPNLAIIVTFMLLFAASGINKTMGNINGMWILLGVFSGGALWWFILTSGISLFRKKFRPRHLLWLNRIGGALIIVLGIVAIVAPLFNIKIDGFLH